MSAPGNALDTTFRDAGAAGSAVLIPYLTAGYPNPERFVDLAVGVLEAGADALEIGIPFSDPLLDGPSIQRSQQSSLDAGVTPESCLTFASEIHRRSPKPLLFMGAYNPLLAYGLDHFCKRSEEAGVTALVIPDLPVEEQHDLRRAAHRHGLHIIQLVAPTSTSNRLDRACAIASGFIYCISVSGVTGARTGVTETARPLVQRVKERTAVPVAVGFGIGTPAVAREVATFAEGVIVGSALIDIVGRAGGAEDAGAQFVRSLSSAIKSRGAD